MLPCPLFITVHPIHWHPPESPDKYDVEMNEWIINGVLHTDVSIDRRLGRGVRCLQRQVAWTVIAPPERKRAVLDVIGRRSCGFFEKSSEIDVRTQTGSSYHVTPASIGAQWRARSKHNAVSSPLPIPHKTNTIPSLRKQSTASNGSQGPFLPVV